jgi:hypothetical protein
MYDPGRDKSYKAFIDDMLFIVYPQLNFAAQIMNVILVGAKEGNHFRKRMGMGFHTGFVSRPWCWPFAGPKPEGLGIEGSPRYGFTIQVYDAVRYLFGYFVPETGKLQIWFVMKDKMLS